MRKLQQKIRKRTNEAFETEDNGTQEQQKNGIHCQS